MKILFPIFLVMCEVYCLNILYLDSPTVICPCCAIVWLSNLYPPSPNPSSAPIAGYHRVLTFYWRFILLELCRVFQPSMSFYKQAMAHTPKVLRM